MPPHITRSYKQWAIFYFLPSSDQRTIDTTKGDGLISRHDLSRAEVQKAGEHESYVPVSGPEV